MFEINVNLPNRSYPIYIGKGMINQISTFLSSYIQGKKVVVISDENVFSLHGKSLKSLLLKEGYKVHTIILSPGEQSKSFQTLEHLYDEFMDFGLTKSDGIIAFGGGVVGDLTGFAAATFSRGVPYIQIPTTLLSQVDSSVGGKTAINHKKGKNMIGAFYHPCFVIIDTLYLNTLSPIFFTDGMAEVIKYGCIFDRELFEMLLASNGDTILSNADEIISRCCQLKKETVEVDEYDNGERMKLNFGHTIGHAVESKLGYTGITHGMGVAIGMYTITKQSEAMGLTSVNTSEMIKEILMQYHLPYEIPDISKEELLSVMTNDKKARGTNMNLILLKKIGKSYIHQIDQSEMKHFL